MNYKKLYRFIPITLGVVAFGYFYLYKYVYLNKKHFEDNKIDAKIIRVYNYENKSLEFYYSEKYCVTSSTINSDTLIIGDSISKEAHTTKFDVYRNKHGRYRFYKRYDAER